MSSSGKRAVQAGVVLLALSACERTEPGDNPFAPVQVAPAALQALPDAAGTTGGEGEDPRFAEAEPFVISSEELRAQAEATPAPEEPQPTPEPAPAASVDGIAEVEPAPAPETSPEPAAPTPPAQTVSPSPAPFAGDEGGGWPVRLVRTLPDTQPPRAILGLPDGREIVVSPGSMIPEQSLVVMSVGRDTLQVARISARGDHATVSQTTLRSMY